MDIDQKLPKTVGGMADQFRALAIDLEAKLDALAVQRRDMDAVLFGALIADGHDRDRARRLKNDMAIAHAHVGAGLNEAATMCWNALDALGQVPGETEFVPGAVH